MMEIVALIIFLLILVGTLGPKLILLILSLGLVLLLLVISDLAGALGTLLFYVALAVLVAFLGSRWVDR